MGSISTGFSQNAKGCAGEFCVKKHRVKQVNSRVAGLAQSLWINHKKAPKALHPPCPNRRQGRGFCFIKKRR